jgi:hypothetical protein
MMDRFTEEPAIPIAASFQALAERVAGLEATVAAHAAALGLAAPEPQPAVTTDALRAVWDAAPVAVRLAFVRGSLPAEHPRQGALAEAASLVELAASSDALATWIASYPALFADASAKLVTVAPPQPDDDADALAGEVLAAARDVTAAALTAMGIVWVAPRPGEPISGDCEVIGEASSEEVSDGRIHTLKRPGFRRQGRLELRAQVLRASRGPSPASVEQAPPSVTPAAAPIPAAAAAQAPGWLVELQRRSTGAGAAAANLTQGLMRLAAAPAAAREQELRRALEPLLPLLGAGWSSALADVPGEWLEEFARLRPRLEAWLCSELGAEILAPQEGEPFDPETMEATAERRTAHAHERGRVAKVHSAGLRSVHGLLIRAQVSRYTAGGAA